MRAISKRIVAAAVMLTPLGALAQSAPPSKHVLGLYWDAKENSANDDFERTFRAALRYAVAGSVEYYSEYLDSERFPGENQSEALRDYIQRKYARRPIDVVVTNAIPSLDFLFKYRGELFPRTPIVFSSTSRPSAAQLKTGAGATGIIYVTSYRKTLDLALQLHPATEHVFIVSGATPSGDSWETMARNDLQGFQTSAEITYLTDLPLDGLTARLRTLPERSIVLYVWQRLRDRQGVLLESRDLLSLVAPLIPVPVYGMSFANIGHGIVGGYVWTMETRAAKAAEVASKVLSGTRPQDIPLEFCVVLRPTTKPAAEAVSDTAICIVIGGRKIVR